MKEHPILFNGAMVRAILDGRKTQTRRPVTHQNTNVNGHGYVSKATFARYPLDKAWINHGPSPAGNPGPFLKCDSTHPDDDGAMARLYPQWQVGDALYVRETWAPRGEWEEIRHPGGSVDVVPVTRAIYAADGGHADKWKPSIHMPRWAARLILPVVDVRPRRLHDIDEADARAEGIEQDGRRFLGAIHKGRKTREVFFTAVGAFEDLWVATYGRASWDANPWVWAVTFRFDGAAG